MMNCPSCGAIMVWLNGSILHDPPTKFYHCRRCNIHVTRLPDGSIETDQPEQQQASQ
jgi:hypothetical protein